MTGMEAVFEAMPTLSGDDALKMVAANKLRRRRAAAPDAPPAADLVADSVAERDGKCQGRRSGGGDEGHGAFTRSVVAEIQQIIDAVDDDEDDRIDREQFVDFLAEWGIDGKFDDNELDALFERLRDDKEPAAAEGMASVHAVMVRVRRVHSDHQQYSARKTVYRLCRRLL